MVSKSFNSGRYGGYTQYDSISKFRTSHANFYGALLEGATNSRYIGKTTRTGSLSKLTTRSEWFEIFSLGCVKTMGQVTKSNLSISLPVLLEALNVL